MIFRCARGFTIAELLVTVAIMSFVGLGAMMIVTGTFESQAKLEKTLQKGFTMLHYAGKKLPNDPPNIGTLLAFSYGRFPSPRAYDDKTKTLAGSEPHSTIHIGVLSADTEIESPKWRKCELKDPAGTITVQCHPIAGGKGRIEFSPGKDPRKTATAVVQLEWPSLPPLDPMKLSKTFTFNFRFYRDCELDFPEPAAPRYLEDQQIYYKPQSTPLANGCVENWIGFHCDDGQLLEEKLTRACS